MRDELEGPVSLPRLREHVTYKSSQGRPKRYSASLAALWIAALGCGFVYAQTPPAGRDSKRPALQNSSTDTQAASTVTYALVPVAPTPPPTVPGAKQATAERDDAPWWAELIKSTAWPAALLLFPFLAYVGLFRHESVRLWLSHLWRRTTGINIAGVEIKLNEGAKATIEDIQRLVSLVPAAHQDWVNYSHIEARFQLVVGGLQRYLTSASKEFATPITAADFQGFRLTLHVPDVLLTHSVRQLVDYVGSERGGAGRIFSVRRGIVGQAWRLERSAFETTKFTEDDLVTKWGMTRPEARSTKHEKSVLLAFLIKSEDQLPLGLLYADADQSDLLSQERLGKNLTEQKAFAYLEAHIKSLCDSHGLTKALQELEAARAKIKPVDIYRPLQST